jgi:serine/threonine protein kinase
MNSLSEELKEFLSNCIRVNPNDRFSIDKLIESKFIQKYINNDQNYSKIWLNDVYKIKKKEKKYEKKNKF